MDEGPPDGRFEFMPDFRCKRSSRRCIVVADIDMDKKVLRSSIDRQRTRRSSAPPSLQPEKWTESMLDFPSMDKKFSHASGETGDSDSDDADRQLGQQLDELHKHLYELLEGVHEKEAALRAAQDALAEQRAKIAAKKKDIQSLNQKVESPLASTAKRVFLKSHSHRSSSRQRPGAAATTLGNDTSNSASYSFKGREIESYYRTPVLHSMDLSSLRRIPATALALPQVPARSYEEDLRESTHAACTTSELPEMQLSVGAPARSIHETSERVSTERDHNQWMCDRMAFGRVTIPVTSEDYLEDQMMFDQWSEPMTNGSVKKPCEWKPKPPESVHAPAFKRRQFHRSKYNSCPGRVLC